MRYQERAPSTPFEVDPPRNPRRSRRGGSQVEAITTGIESLREGAALDRELLCQLDEILLRGARSEQKNPGEFRTDLVGIDEPGTPLSEARLVPTPPASIPYALRSLLQYIRSGPTHAPLVDLALIDYQFETIHLFKMGTVGLAASS